MAIYDDDDALYDFENDERLSVEAKVALGMMREQNVTIRYFFRLLADFLGTDVAAKAQEFGHLAELARLKQTTDRNSAPTRPLPIKTKPTIGTKVQASVDTTDLKKDKNSNESSKNNAPVSKSNKDLPSLSSEALASKDSGASKSNGSRGTKR